VVAGLPDGPRLEAPEGVSAISGARPAWAAGLASAILGVAGIVATGSPAPEDTRPNVILVVTDDQTADTIPSDPPAMPWLQSQLDDPSGGWIRFRQAIAATPMCCPARASLLTGLVDRHHGVTSNEDGTDLDETDTLATWLHDVGYETGLVGKYLNDYPWDRGPYVPPGWDRWFAKTNDALATTYEGYGVVDQGIWRRYGHAPTDYVTDVLGREAVAFVRSAPTDRPWFLYLAPPAGHEPWTPAPRHLGLLAEHPPPPLSEAMLNDVEGLPAWIRALAPIDDTQMAQLQVDRVRARETLLAVDDQLRSLWRAVVARGEQDRTVIVVLSDNGYHFGEHRWVGKQTPFEPSLRIPFVARSPWIDGGVDGSLVSTLDVAPTIAALAGVSPRASMDGIDMSVLLGGTGPPIERSGIPISWGGGDEVPAWSGLRTPTRTYVRWADGTTEMYRAMLDPDQLDPVRPWTGFPSDVPGAG
jgi:N-acetylglucosamine-6-sulfatase